MLGDIKISVTPRTTRFVLVDYDNIRRRGRFSNGSLRIMVTHMVNRLMGCTDFLLGIKSGEHIKVRLYGGWFKDDRTTRLAQDIYAEIGQDFPVHMKTCEGVSFEVDCERADRLLSRPRDALYCTYREEDLTPSLNVRNKYCCGQNDTISEYIKTACEKPMQCPACKRRWNNPFLMERVQKMVDAMVYCDLVFLLRDEDNRVSLVSSDADMLPVLFQAEADRRTVYYMRDNIDYDAGLYARYHSQLLGQYCKAIMW